MTVGAQNIRITPHFKYCSHFIEMKDGVKLAIDLFLPKKIEKEIPTVLFLTRYVRSFEPKDIIGFVGPIFGQIKRNEIVHYIKNGYASIYRQKNSNSNLYLSCANHFVWKKNFDWLHFLTILL